jgi:predicted kinase
MSSARRCSDGETDPLPAEAYAREVTARVYGLLADKARRAVTAGHSVVVDAVFAQARERRLVAEAAAVAGVSLRGVFLSADLATRLSRVEARTNDASDADAGVAQRQEAYDLGETGWCEVDASGPRSHTLGQVLSFLGLKPG